MTSKQHDGDCWDAQEEIERLTAELKAVKRSLGKQAGDTIRACQERDRLRAALVSAERVMSGIGAWLLHRFGRGKPETREGDTLLSAAKDARAALAGAADEDDEDPGYVDTGEGPPISL